MTADETPPLNVYQAWGEVQRRIGAIGKDKSAHEGYSYRGIEQFLNELHGVISDVGLIIIPRVVEWDMPGQMAGRKPGWHLFTVVVEYDVYGPDGSTLPLPGRSVGNGADNADKGPGKAMSYAFKAWLGEAFTIPTDTALDNEAFDLSGSEWAHAMPAITVAQYTELMARFDSVPETPIPAPTGELVPARTLVKALWAKGEPARGGAPGVPGFGDPKKLTVDLWQRALGRLDALIVQAGELADTVAGDDAGGFMPGAVEGADGVLAVEGEHPAPIEYAPDEEPF